MWPGGPDEDAVELVPQSAPAPPPPPFAPALANPQPALQPAAPAATADGLVLHGLAGGGAIIGGENGGQRFVRVGREVRPGLVLAAVRQHHALLRSATGDFLLGFTGAEAVAPPQGKAAPSAPVGSRQASLPYRLGLDARKVNGRTVGYSVKPDADLPLLRNAGIRPGDVILKVNGDAFNSGERVTELPEMLRDSPNAEFEIERNGRRITARLQGR